MYAWCLLPQVADRQTARQTASKPLLQLTPVQRKRRKLLIYHCIQCLLSTLCITYSSKNCLALQALLYLRLQIMCGMRARAQAVQISTWGDFDLWQRPFNCRLPMFLERIRKSVWSWVTCRWGPTGQGKLLCDIHSALIRVLEGLDEDLMEAPTMAGYGSATDLAPQDAYRPLLGASWPELARRYLQEHSALTISQEAVDAVVRLKAGHLLNSVCCEFPMSG